MSRASKQKKKQGKGRSKPSGPQVACPGCRRQQAKLGPDANYWCPSCQAMFDDDPDEGGDFFSDPSLRMERQETRRSRHHAQARH